MPVTFQCALARIMVKFLFCLVAENVYGTDCCNVGKYFSGKLIDAEVVRRHCLNDDALWDVKLIR